MCVVCAFVVYFLRAVLQDQRRDLKRLLELASRLGAGAAAAVKGAWARHAKTVGSSLACDEARDKDLVSRATGSVVGAGHGSKLCIPPPPNCTQTHFSTNKPGWVSGVARDGNLRRAMCSPLQCLLVCVCMRLRVRGRQVSLLLALKDRLEVTLRDAFGWGGHWEPFKAALKDSLEVAANSRPASAHGKTLAELMSKKDCDLCIRAVQTKQPIMV